MIWMVIVTKISLGRILSEQVKAILEKDENAVYSRDKDKDTPLHYAASQGSKEIATLLIQKGASLNAQNYQGYTPLHWAAHHDNVDIIKSMISKGAKLNVQNLWSMTELHTAIWRGNIHVVEYLLDQGSDPMIRTNEGWTAMHYAFRSGHDNIIDMLKKRGLSLRVQDNDGRYPQHLYFKKPNAIELFPEELSEYTGKYYIGDYLMLEIWREGQVLKVMEFGPDEIYPVAKDFFYFKQAPWTLIFTRDEKDNILHAQLSFIRRSYTIVRK